MKKIKENHYSYSHIPHYLENNEYLKEIGINGFITAFDKLTVPDHFDAIWNEIPFDLRKDPRLQQRLHQREEQILQQNKQAFNLMDINFRKGF